METPTMCENPAPGGPGQEPRWSSAAKDAVGTAYAAGRLWYTLAGGIVTEVYYPTIDRPQIRDLQYLITDGENFFHEEQRDLHSTVEALAPNALGVRVTSRDPAGRYQLVKEIIADPYQTCLLVHTRLEAEPEVLARLQL